MLELFRAMVPVRDLFGKTLFDGGLSLCNKSQLRLTHLCEVFWYYLRYRVFAHLLLQLSSDPRAFGACEEGVDSGFVFRERSIVEIWSVVNVARNSVGSKLNI